MYPGNMLQPWRRPVKTAARPRPSATRTSRAVSALCPSSCSTPCTLSLTPQPSLILPGVPSYTQHTTCESSARAQKHSHGSAKAVHMPPFAALSRTSKAYAWHHHFLRVYSSEQNRIKHPRARHPCPRLPCASPSTKSQSRAHVLRTRSLAAARCVSRGQADTCVPFAAAGDETGGSSFDNNPGDLGAGIDMDASLDMEVPDEDMDDHGLANFSTSEICAIQVR